MVIRQIAPKSIIVKNQKWFCQKKPIWILFLLRKCSILLSSILEKVFLLSNLSTPNGPLYLGFFWAISGEKIVVKGKKITVCRKNRLFWYGFFRQNDYHSFHEIFIFPRPLATSAWTSYSKLKNSKSFNPQNSNSAKLKLKKTWKTRITWSKTRSTRAKVELGTCSNSTVWNSMKLELAIKWAGSSTISYQQVKYYFKKGFFKKIGNFFLNLYFFYVMVTVCIMLLLTMKLCIRNRLMLLLLIFSQRVRNTTIRTIWCKKHFVV